MSLALVTRQTALVLGLGLSLMCGNALAGTVVLPETGQTTCYDTTGSVIPCAGTGQDGDRLAGVAWPSPRFTNNGNGTITDNLTGLIWLQNALCFSGRSGAQALNDADTLNSGECGLSDGSVEGDWRLPNVNELNSLVNAEQVSTAAWLNSQGFTNVLNGVYWSSTNWVVLTASAWSVIMYSGTPAPRDKGYANNVLPVRATTTLPAELWKTGQTTCYDYVGSVIACPGTGQDGDWLAGVPWPSPRFTDNSNGTVTDNLTGLIWLKNADCFSVQTWANALNSASTMNSGECGLSDGSVEGGWRLPNTIELRSVSDYSQAFPGLPSGHPFTNVQSSFPSFYWSSSTYAANPGNAFIVDHWEAGGSVNVDAKTGSHYVWPVRGGQLLSDYTPNAFTFIDVTGVPLSTVQTSNAVTVIGITAPAEITIVGGEYQVNGAGPWTSSAGTVANGDTVQVRHTSAATYSTAVNTTLTIGGVSDTFTSTTLTVSNGPDLIGAWNPVSQVCHRNRCTLRGSVRVWNQGNAPAPTARLRVILSDDAVMGPSDAVLRESSIGQLRPGQSRTRPINVPLPRGVNASGKYLFAVIDAPNAVAETIETNNEPWYEIP
jgi:hypothetical protein